MRGYFLTKTSGRLFVLIVFCAAALAYAVPSYAADTTTSGSTLPLINTNAILERLPSPVGEFINSLKGVHTRTPSGTISNASSPTIGEAGGEVKINGQTIFDFLKKAVNAIERLFGRSLQEIARIIANVIVALLEFLLGIIKALISKI